MNVSKTYYFKSTFSFRTLQPRITLTQSVLKTWKTFKKLKILKVTFKGILTVPAQKYSLLNIIGIILNTSFNLMGFQKVQKITLFWGPNARANIKNYLGFMLRKIVKKFKKNLWKEKINFSNHPRHFIYCSNPRLSFQGIFYSFCQNYWYCKC